MNQSSTHLRVLVIEDNDGDARLLQEALRAGSATAVELERARTLTEGLARLDGPPPDAVLLDLNLPDSQGMETLRRVCTRAPRTPVIVLTGLHDESAAIEALRQGAQDYLLKSELDERLLPRAIRYARERKETEVLLRDMQDQLLQSQRMESVGRLAGGIAHDFNNMMTVIQGYARMMLETLPNDSVHRNDVEAIATAADRAVTLTRQLLAYSRKQVMQLRVINAGELLHAIEDTLRRLLRPDMILTLTSPPDLGQVEADPSQIEQVILNLAANARDAMPKGGNLTISCSNITLDAPWAQRHFALRPGEYVQIAVTDTGAGMTDDIAQKIFDPFFTTKPFGEGTGLGLATVYGIIRQHNGHVWVYSEPGHGTTMKVVLPRLNRGMSSRASAAAPQATSAGSETLLLVEDEPEILTMLGKSLQGLGYTVLTAGNGRAALTLMQQHSHAVSLLITDIVLPDLAGPELAEGLRGIQPTLHVLFMSAYPGDAVVARGLIAPDAPFICKPFTPEALARRVRDVLSAGPPPPVN